MKDLKEFFENITWENAEDTTQKVIRVVIWFIATMIAWTAWSALINATSTILCILGFLFFCVWVWVTIKTRFFLRKYHLKHK